MLQTAAEVGIDEEWFWRMTPAQFKRRVAAVAELRQKRMEVEKRREESAQHRAAWICATIMNFAGKQLPKGKTIKAEDLLKKKRTEGELDRARDELIRRHRLSKRFNIN